MYSNIKGNALFLILIAVALFAALSYAITSSGRGGGGIEKEQQQLDDAVAEQCTAMVERGENKLKILNGCSDSEISYEIAGNVNENPANTDGTECFVFHQDGADVTPCGIYTESLGVPTGTITDGDTTTIALLASGTYFKCASWALGQCRPQFSLDGSAFFGPSNVCLDTGSGYIVSPPALAQQICQQACGGNNAGHSVLGGSPGTRSHVITASYNINTYGSSCANGNSLLGMDCDCW